MYAKKNKYVPLRFFSKCMIKKPCSESSSFIRNLYKTTSDSDEQPSSPSQSMFMSLPDELLLDILARVPRRYYPILSCVCWELREVVRDREIQEKRSLLGLDSIYISFLDKSTFPKTRHWFTIRRNENNPSQNVFTPIDFPSPRFYSSIFAVGPEIFFTCGSILPSSSFWIFDSRSGKLRQGPDMLQERCYNSIAQVGGKIYVMGGCSSMRGCPRDGVIEAESFDMKKQIWEAAPFPHEYWCRSITWGGVANISFDRKVCALSSYYGMTCYDTKDGSCENFDWRKNTSWKRAVCVIRNVPYIYDSTFGLMWFDTDLMSWEVVDGLHYHVKVRAIGMAEYYGKLALLWKKNSFETNEIWCTMIDVAWSWGTSEPPQLLGTVPRSYRPEHCLSVTS